VKRRDPGFIAYKVTRNLGYGYMLLGIFSLVAGFLLLLIGSSLVFTSLLFTTVILLGFAGLVVFMALYKLGEVTENHKIKSGFKIFGYGLLLAFFGAPITSIVGSVSIFLALGIIGLAFIVPLIGWIYVLLGLVEYGKLEGSNYIVRYSFLAMILTIIYPLATLFIVTFSYQNFAPLIVFIDFTLGLFSLLVSFLLGLEFRKISIKVKKAIDTLDISELKKEIEEVPLENLVNISRSRDIPYILLASIRTG